ncbi:mannitol-1-phosphate 5-dehydrogenase [Brachyspira pilosicoli]|uniref:mannitol-1-phosphate 5-dehydrogenase n=1 Tax=Brachyspira pilosicoli TaxID=52584 RepID=UPI002493599D|nr:mannitol-1-phosphate 5-dehydrogenase [Brachyspira pilosicoli]
MKKMIQIGAGNIGRACVGRLFHEAGYEVYFSDINTELLSLISDKKYYNIRMVGKDVDKTIKIDKVDKVPDDEESLLKLFDDIEIITTAVGVNILPKIAPFVAKAINRRFDLKNDKPLNVIACENTTGASSKLKESVYALLKDDVKRCMHDIVAFPNVAVDCIVPNIKNSDPLTVTCENFADLIIDKDVFIGDLPEVEGLSLKQNLDAYVERKLFTLNTGHAITAYLGFINNKKTIYDAINEESIKNIVLGAMRESGAVLVKRHGFKEDEHEAYIQKILSRFFNPYLEDSVLRVGREPMRKLSYNDRLIKPILGTLEYNLKHNNLVKGVVAAFQFYSEDDNESKELKKMLDSESLSDVVMKVTGLKNEKTLFDEIYSELNKVLKK